MGRQSVRVLGFEDQSLLTQMIDLFGHGEELWSGLAQSARQAVRKAQQAGYRAAKVDWPSHLGAYYRCIARPTGGPASSIPTPAPISKASQAFSAATGANVLFAAFGPDGQALAFHNDARLAPGATYHTGCSLDAAKRGLGLWINLCVGGHPRREGHRLRLLRLRLDLPRRGRRKAAMA